MKSINRLSTTFHIPKFYAVRAEFAAMARANESRKPMMPWVSLYKRAITFCSHVRKHRETPAITALDFCNPTRKVRWAPPDKLNKIREIPKVNRLQKEFIDTLLKIDAILNPPKMEKALPQPIKQHWRIIDDPELIVSSDFERR